MSKDKTSDAPKAEARAGNKTEAKLEHKEEPVVRWRVKQYADAVRRHSKEPSTRDNYRRSKESEFESENPARNEKYEKERIREEYKRSVLDEIDSISEAARRKSTKSSNQGVSEGKSSERGAERESVSIRHPTPYQPVIPHRHETTHHSTPHHHHK